MQFPYNRVRKNKRNAKYRHFDTLSWTSSMKKKNQAQRQEHIHH